MDFWLGIAVVFATLTGPLLAVLVTRTRDKRGQRRSRQMEVFRALMRSRRSSLSLEYVTALNTVEVEFPGVKPVGSAQRELFRHLSLSPQPPDWLDRLRRLQTRLPYAMAKVSRLRDGAIARFRRRLLTPSLGQRGGGANGSSASHSPTAGRSSASKGCYRGKTDYRCARK